MNDLSFGWGFLTGVISGVTYLIVVGMVKQWEINREIEKNKKYWQEVESNE